MFEYLAYLRVANHLQGLVWEQLENSLLEFPANKKSLARGKMRFEAL